MLEEDSDNNWMGTRQRRNQTSQINKLLVWSVCGCPVECFYFSTPFAPFVCFCLCVAILFFYPIF